MNTMVDLSRFLAPRKVALVGATDDLSKFSGRCLQQMIGFGYKGDIYPVNPSRAIVQGLPCYPSVNDLPDTPDHVGIVVSPERAIEVVRQCGISGVPFVTVFSSGFAETGTDEGRALQQQLLDVARAGNVRLMGPNCNGTINFLERFAMTSSPSASGDQPPPGSIAVLSHSGGVGHINVMWRALELGLGLSYVVTCGNDADLDLVDFGRYCIEQDHIQVLLLVAERFGDGRKFVDLAKRAALLGKPIIAIKLGRTPEGSKAAASHTGAITGEDAVCDAVFRQYGIIRVDDCHELYDMAMLLRTKRRANGPRAGGISTTGGNVVLASDLGSSRGLQWPEYSTSTQQALQEITGAGALLNPTDTTTSAHGVPGMYRRALAVIAEDAGVDMVMPILNFPPAADVEFVQQLALGHHKPVAVCWVGGAREVSALTRRQLVESGVSVHRDILPCLKAMRVCADYSQFINTFQKRSDCVRPAAIDVDGAQRYLATKSQCTELESLKLLDFYGITTIAGDVAADKHAVLRIAHDINGPVALKISSKDIQHKTEVNGVRLAVSGESELHRQYLDILSSAQRLKPDADIEGVLVQAMVPQGLEIMAGIVQDSVFGPIVVVAHGGIHVETYHDVAYRLPPFNHAEAALMISELRVYPFLLGGARMPERDLEALIEALVRISWLAVDCSDFIAELDINPMIVLEKGLGVCAVDALVILK